MNCCESALAPSQLTLPGAQLRDGLVEIRDLLQERGFSREQAYVLCSVAVDLRVSNVVDVPNVTVSALLPEDIFTSGG